jgi:colanic acid biosynthesis glycosyl transferase WcaI
LKVLVVNQYYPPDTSATAKVFEELVLKLVSNGHRVRVICGRPSYNPSGKRAWRMLSRSLEHGVVVERVGSSGVGRERMWGRVANYLTFFLAAGIRVLVSPRPDIVVAGSDPPFSVWIALLAARGRPVVYSLQDLHPEFAIVSGMIRPGIVTKVWEAVHRSALKRCALVVCLGETMAKRVRAKGVPDSKIAVVPLGAPSPVGVPDLAVVEELRHEAELLCVHAGNLGGGGAWETLAQASDALPGGSELLFIGDGFNSDVIDRSHIRLLPFRPIDELASVMAAGDLQVVTLRPGLEGLILPSKLYTALAYGRPILAVAPDESEVSQIVRHWGCGLVADPADAGDVVAKITWARENPGELAKMSKRALEAAQHYDRETQLGKLVELIENQASLA